MALAKNIGDKDSLYRAIGGVILLIWGISAQTALGLLGFVLLATAYFRVCPIYIPMDVDTTK